MTILGWFFFFFSEFNEFRRFHIFILITYLMHCILNISAIFLYHPLLIHPRPSVLPALFFCIQTMIVLWHLRVLKYLLNFQFFVLFPFVLLLIVGYHSLISSPPTPNPFFIVWTIFIIILKILCSCLSLTLYMNSIRYTFNFIFNMYLK